jgi:hypothetical protein
VRSNLLGLSLAQTGGVFRSALITHGINDSMVSQLNSSFHFPRFNSFV